MFEVSQQAPTTAHGYGEARHIAGNVIIPPSASDFIVSTGIVGYRMPAVIKHSAISRQTLRRSDAPTEEVQPVET
jgi:hypothetical protein